MLYSIYLTFLLLLETLDKSLLQIAAVERFMLPNANSDTINFIATLNRFNLQTSRNYELGR